MSEPRPDAFGKFVGGLILAVGALVAFLSGACTLSFAAAFLRPGGGDASGLVLVAVIGGVPFLVGLAMMGLGWSIVRPRKRPGAEVFGERPPPPDA